MAKEVVSKRVVSSNKLVLEGIYSQGYGIVAKMVMKDKRLSIEAKGIYSYLCSYCGKGETAFPSVELQISDLGISENRYFKHRKQLIDLGYIRVETQREKVEFEDGTTQERRTNNVYTIVTSLPLEPLKGPEKPKKEVSKMAKVQHLYFEGIENEGTNNNNLTNNNIINNSSSSKSKKEEEEKVKPAKNIQIDNSADIKRIMQHCQECSFKLQKRTVEKLIKTYSADTIIQAITTATESNTEIEKPGPYLMAVLNDMGRSKTVTVNVNSKDSTKQNKFNQFPQRDYKPDEMQSMEQRLLNKKKAH